MCEVYKNGRMLSYEHMCHTHRDQFYAKPQGLESMMGYASSSTATYQKESKY